MSFSINTNLTSLQAQNYLQKSSQFQAQTINQVTSGLRIVNSGDDAAGLAIANGFRSDEAVLNQGIQNANNGLATLQTIDSGMNNISTLLDRARTLATESASGTFSGNRATLNQEFQSVITEVTRQAQAIGMNQGGNFAQALSVFIGGGKGATSASAATNGTINMDLSKSAVDAQSLGLQGVQAQGNASVDLSAASSTSVQKLVADATNKSSEMNGGYTAFSFKGAGFSDGNAIGISVNLSGVTDTQTLATAINSAIQSAGNGVSSASTAFKNANITASVVTDSSGGQHLAFSSSNAAFQVQAGDQTSNALLGNISSGTTGAALQTTFAGGAALGNLTTTVASQATTINLQFQGAGMTQAHTVSVSVNAQDTLASVLTSVTSAVASDSTLQKAGITVDPTHSVAGQNLTFQSAGGQQFSVAAGGDVDNLLGLGSARLGAASSVQYSTIAGGSAYNNATAQGTAHFQVSFNGGAAVTLGDVNLSLGDATATKVTGAALTGGVVNTSAVNQLSITIDGTKHAIDLTSGGHNSATESLAQVAADITTQLGSAGTATVNSSNQLVITSATKGAASSVVIGTAPSADASTALKLTSATTATTTAGTSRSGADIQNYLNQQIASNTTLSAAGLQATYNGGTNKLSIASNNGTQFQLNAYADNTKGAVTGTLAGGNASITGTVTAAQAITSTNQNLRVNVDGTNYDVKLTLGGARTTAQIATDIQSVFTAAGSSATATTNGSGNIVITSGTGGSGSSVTISNTTNPNDASTVVGVTGANTGLAATTAATVVGSSSVLGTIDATHKILDIAIDGVDKLIDITGAANMAAVATKINAAGTGFGAAIATVDGTGKLNLNSLTTGAASEVKVTVGGANDASGVVNLSTADTHGAAATAGIVTGTASGSQTITATNNSLDLSIDGTQYKVALTQGARTMAQIATDVNTAVGSSVATVDGGGHLVITSGTTGATSNVTIGNNDAFDGATITGLVGKTNTGAGSFAITAGTNDTLTFKVDGGSNQSITLASGAALSATSLSADINAKLATAHITGIAASVNGSGDLVLSSQFGGSGHSVQVVSGTQDASAALGLGTTQQTGTDANVGFGITGGVFAGNTQGTAPTTSPDVLSAGAYQTAGIAFSALANGADSQTINVSATDTSGATHTSNIVLHNNATSQTGASIDSALNAINNALQQSNVASLQNVTAVKYNNAGTEQIKFISANTQFGITVGTTGSGSGLNGAGIQGTTLTAAVTGTGSTADISTQTGAGTAVNALANAVQILGTAQAAVGKGENNLNYAVSLAQSQSTNEAAAESQIRDANLAQEAANLTKAQILVQAGTAALAQANSAPQQLLSLLQGH